MGSKKIGGSVVRYSSNRDSFWDKHFTFSPDKSPKLSYALVVIFMEFFSWGLLTMTLISILPKTFPNQTFLCNGIIMGTKGILSFLSAPMIGAMSDLWGRKPFLLITVFFTCFPIPFITINPMIHFILLAFSGLFSVTFSVVFAYVSDITDEQNRAWAYGAVSATFAFSLVISPAAGSYIQLAYGDDWVVLVATLIALADVAFIVICIPESLPEKLRLKSISIWETADPFVTIRRAGNDPLILRLVFAVLLSYLPEAGQYSCFFLYLKLIIGFSVYNVTFFIAMVGLLSIFAQTFFLSFLIRKFGAKNAITIGLIFEMIQLICYGLGSNYWVIWSAGIIAAASSITYPAISAYVSNYADDDKQGLVQGMITGVRGLCTGIGPAVFGIIFFSFGVDLNSKQSEILPVFDNSTIKLGEKIRNFINDSIHFHHKPFSPTDQLIPGPPFLFGAILVLLAILVMAFIPEVITYLPNSSNYAENHKAGAKMSLSRTSLSSSGGGGQLSRNASLNHQDYYYKSVQHLSDSEQNPCQIDENDNSGMKILSPQLLGVSSHHERHTVDIEDRSSGCAGEDDSMLYMIEPSMSCTLSETESDSDAGTFEIINDVRQRSMSQHHHLNNNNQSNPHHQQQQQHHHRSHDILLTQNNNRSRSSSPDVKLIRSLSCKNRTTTVINNSKQSNMDTESIHLRNINKNDIHSQSDRNVSLQSSSFNDHNNHNHHSASSNYHSSHQHLFNSPSLRPLGI